MLRFKQFFTFMITLQLCVAHDQCPEEFKELQSHCVCVDQRVGNDIWCPNSERPKIRFHTEPSVLWLTCHDIDDIDLKYHLQNVSYTTIELVSLVFNDCQIPSESYSSLLEVANISEMDQLHIERGYSETDTLPADLFAGLNVKHLRLTDNHVKSIHSDTFHGLRELQSLVLSSNGIQEFPPDFLLHIPSIRRLDIIEPKAKTFPNDMLKNLTELVSVRLEIAQLHPNFFDNNVKIQNLNLKNYDASNVDPTIFSTLLDLKNVTLSGRGFTSLPLNLFENNLELTEFEWSHDKCVKGFSCQVKPASFLQNHTQLQRVSMTKSYTSGVVLNEDFLWGCPNVLTLSMTRLRLRELPQLLFKDTLKLQTIDLSKNRLTKLPDTIFHSLRNLMSLNLQGNFITVISDMHFKRGSTLRFLDMSKNALTALGQKAFDNCVLMETLDLSSNMIYFNDSSKPTLKAMKRLQILDLSNNSLELSHMPEEFRTIFTQLRVLNLQLNNIGPSLEVFPDLNFQSHELKVDLSHNNLQHLSYSLAHKHVTTNHARHVSDVIININNNPFKCDCRNVDLAMHLRNKLAMSAVTSWFSFRPGVTCANGQLLSSKPIDSMKCTFPSDFIQQNCSDPCTCTIIPYQSEDNLESEMTVNCSEKGIPKSLPHLEKTTGQIVLDLSHNGLKNLEGVKEIRDYQNITKLVLSYNNLTEIRGQQLPPHLNALFFDHNKIESLNYADLRQSVSMAQSIKLGGNPYDCSCKSRLLYRFVRRNSGSKVKDAEQVWLNCDDGKRFVNDINVYSEFCTETKTLIYEVAVPVGIFIVAILLALVFILWNKDKVFAYIYSKPALRSLVYKHDESLDDKRYDVFISYANEDKEFVEQQMIPILEDDSSEYKYRCLFHVRDFVPGENIQDQIVNAVNNSTRTLIVLSHGFLQSTWALHE